MTRLERDIDFFFNQGFLWRDLFPDKRLFIPKVALMFLPRMVKTGLFLKAVLQ